MSATLQKAPTQNYWSSSLNGAINDSVDTITLNSTTGLQAPGYIVIDREDGSGTGTPNSREVVSYTGISGNDLTGCTRGDDTSTARSHSDGALVEATLTIGMWNDMQDFVAVSLATADGTLRPISTATITNLSLTNLAFASAATISYILDEDTMASNSASALSTQQSIKAYVDANAGTTTGWIAAGETWTYASADDPTYTFTIAATDATAKYSAGMRIKLTNDGSVKYFIITKVVFDDPGSTITVYGGTDYDLADAAITLPFYSPHKAPLGFPLSPAKWQVLVEDTTDRNQGSPTASTWYNLGSVSINIPLGIWEVDYHVVIHVDKAGAWGAFATLSDANNSESDPDFTTNVQGDAAFEGGSVWKSKLLDLSAAKDTYYINTMTTASSVTAIYNRNSDANGGTLRIRARCSYL